MENDYSAVAVWSRRPAAGSDLPRSQRQASVGERRSVPVILRRARYYGANATSPKL